jgi:hypothetical protein
VVLQLEAEMNARKQEVDEAACELRCEDAKTKPNVKLVSALQDTMKGYLENWLNSADRLAYCILHDYLPERDWRSEYRDLFMCLVRNHEDQFGPKSIYTNIIDLTPDYSPDPL